MKTFCDLLATETSISIEMELRPEFELFAPQVTVAVNGVLDSFELRSLRCLQWQVPLLDLIDIKIQVEHDDRLDHRRGVEIARVDIDKKILMPQHCRLAELSDNLVQYAPTNHIVQHGCWSLRIDRPFYQWYHDISKQGWLLEP